MGRAINAYATELVPAEDYLSDEWFKLRRSTVSASEVAVILGISPWRSPFDLWWSKRLGDEQAENASMRRGRRLEPLVLEDFVDEHPEFTLMPAGLCASNARPWQACTPDALAYETCDLTIGTTPDLEPVAVVEAKTDGNADAWGEQNTDAIPPYYRAQVLWQMDTLGLTAAFVPVWIGTTYREYQLQRDHATEVDLELMRTAAREFLSSLESGVAPDIDAHPATTRRLRQLHPSLIDGDAEVPAVVVRQYHAAKRLRDAAQDRMNLAENRVRNALGDYRTATVDGRKVATRSVSDVKARTQHVAAHTRNTIRFTKPKGATT